MVDCPKCGAMNPEGARNCRECYHPFGLEKVIQETGQAPAAPPPQVHPGSPAPGPGGPQQPPPQHYVQQPPPGTAGPQGPPPQQYYQQPPPGPGGPEGPLPPNAQVLRVRPLESKRKVHPAVWVGIGISVVVIIFAVAWFITSASKGSNPYLREVFENMESLQGWEASVRVDNSDFAADPVSYNLYGSWEGELVYQAPDRFSMSARSLDGQYTYSMRIIDDTFYEYDNFSSHWSDLGPVSEEDKMANPLWDYTLLDELTIEEEQGLEEVEGIMCKAYSFDEEVVIEEETFMGQAFEIAYHFQGKFLIDQSRDLLISLDYIVIFEGYGRSHYQYSFYAFDEPTLVEVPPGV